MNDKAATETPRPPRPAHSRVRILLRRFRRVILSILLIVAIGAFFGVRYLTDPVRVRDQAQAALQRLAGADVSIESAHFGFNGTLTLAGIDIRLKDSAGDEGRLISAGLITVDHDMWSLIGGQFKPLRIVVDQPRFYVTEDVAKNQFQFQLLSAQQSEPQGPAPKPGKTKKPPRLPDVFLNHGRVVFGELSEEKYRVTGSIDVHANLRAQRADTKGYDFAITQRTAEKRVGSNLHGSFDLHSKSIEATLEKVVINSPLGHMLPTEVRTWYEKLNPDGSVPTVYLNYDPEKGTRARLEVKDVAMTMPYDWLERTRLSEVCGYFDVVGDNITVELAGAIKDPNYNAGFAINGNIDGFDLDAPFKLDFEIKKANVTKTPQNFPEKVQRILNMYEPRGEVAAMVMFERKEKSGKVIAEGQIDLINAECTYVHFPYPIHDVSGSIHINPDRVKIIDFRGTGKTGSNIVLNGTVNTPRNGKAIDLVIDYEKFPIDEHFYTSLSARFEKNIPIIETFKDPDQYQRLIELGLIRTAESDPTDAHPFNLAGRADGQVFIKRGEGDEGKWSVGLDMNMKGLNVLYRHWPYPLQVTGGILRTRGRHVTLENVTAKGLNGGTGTLNGTINPTKIEFSAKGLPTDDMMLATIPEGARQWIADLHLDGKADFRGVIVDANDPEDPKRVTWKVDAKIRDGVANPNGGEYRLDDLAADVTIGPDKTTINSATARHGKSTLAFSSEHAKGHTRLKLKGTALRFEDPVLDMVPKAAGESATEEAAGLVKQHKPAGTFDLDLDYKVTGDDPANYLITMRPKDVELDQNKQRIALSKMTGSVYVTRDEIELKNIGGQIEGGSVSISGPMRSQSAKRVLTFDAQASSINTATRAMLPSGVINTIDGLSLGGAYRIKGATLTYDGDKSRFDGTVHMSNATANLGVPVTDMNASVELHVNSTPQHETPLIDIRFRASELRIENRLIAPLSAQIGNAKQRNTLLVSELKGSCYGGVLIGTGRVDLNGTETSKKVRYLADLKLQDVAYAKFTEPEKKKDEALKNKKPDPTTLSVSLLLEGVAGEPASKRGRGQVRVRDAALYELPVAMAVLHLLNFTLPSSSAFDKVDARYMIEGDRVRFDSVAIQSPTIEIYGDGMMEYPTRKVDLLMHTQNPGAPKLGGLTEIFNVVKDTLISIHVTGTLEKPKASVISLRGAARSWEQVFGPLTKRIPKVLPRGPLRILPGKNKE